MSNLTRLTRTLTLSASRSLVGIPISDTIAKDWNKAGQTAQRFDNQGFDLDLENFDYSLVRLRPLLKQQTWDGIIIGWCMRGYKERTVMFEQLVAICVDELRAKPESKIVFCNGPDDLFESTMRHFG